LHIRLNLHNISSGDDDLDDDLDDPDDDDLDDDRFFAFALPTAPPRRVNFFLNRKDLFFV
jgi:hypothetical protein